MTLWTIEREIEACVDPETGELDETRFAELELAREQKLESIALLIKTNKMLLAGIDEEKKNLTARKAQVETTIDRLSALLDSSLCGEKFQTPRCSISWRTNESVDISKDAVVPEMYCNVKTTVEPSKTALKAALKNGEIISGVTLKVSRTAQIK